MGNWPKSIKISTGLMFDADNSSARNNVPYRKSIQEYPTTISKKIHEVFNEPACFRFVTQLASIRKVRQKFASMFEYATFCQPVSD